MVKICNKWSLYPHTLVDFRWDLDPGAMDKGYGTHVIFQLKGHLGVI